MGPKAAIIIQKCWRAMKSRIVRGKWRFLTFRLSRVILPKIKRFLNNIFYSKYGRKKEHYYATIIQSVIRMHLCRAANMKMIGNHCFFEGMILYKIYQSIPIFFDFTTAIAQSRNSYEI